MAQINGSQVFVNGRNEPVKIWVDPTLPVRNQLAPLLQVNGAVLSTNHEDAETAIIVLNPSTLTVFDRYCHPAWLSMAGRFRRLRRVRAGEAEDWKRKVVVTEEWPGKCMAAGRFLGEEDDWADCRKGGPAKRIPVLAPSSPEPVPIVIVEPESTSSPAHFTQEQASMPTGPRALLDISKIPGLPARPRSLANSPDRSTPTATTSTAATPHTSEPTRKSKPISVVLQTGQPSIALRTSQWQGPQTPPKILDGLRFFLDGGRFGKRYTMSNIQLSGGSIVDEPSSATHCLLSPVSAAQGGKRRQLIAGAVAAGAWCVTYDFVEKSWEAGYVLDEPDFVYQGGRPRKNGATVEIDAPTELPQEINSPVIDHSDHPERTPTRLEVYKQQYSTEELDERIRAAHVWSLKPGATAEDVVDHLHNHHPNPSIRKIWRDAYKEWLGMTERFAASRDDTRYTLLIPVFTSYLPALRGAASFDEIAQEINASPHSVLSIAEMKVHLGNWLRTFQPDFAGKAALVAKEEQRLQSLPRRKSLATIFKRDHDLSRRPVVDISEEVAAGTIYNATNISLWFYQWRNRKWTDIPKSLQPAVPGQIPIPGRGQKRKR